MCVVHFCKKKIGKTPAVVKRVFTLHVDIAEANNVLQPF